ncbi:MAG: type II secretion system protein [Desulfobacteraceae bacterium]|nr:type II secretion system protein [Desulfobacteraceae bacterium]
MKKESGFTLLELLISITLMAVIVVILSMSVRAGIRAWTRGEETNKALLIDSSIENLLSRQLMTALGTNSGDLAQFAMFKGGPDELSFVTTYAPLGSQMGGIFWVIYRYDEDKGEFVYAQRLVTRKEELSDQPPGSFDENKKTALQEAGWVYSKVEDVPPMYFFYCKDTSGMSSPDEWKQTWDEGSGLPAAVVLGWGAQDGSDGRENKLSYRFFCTDPFCSQEKKK